MPIYGRSGDYSLNVVGHSIGSFECSFVAEECPEQPIRNGHADAQRCLALLPLFNRRFTGEESRPADSNWQTERREPLPTRSECDGTIFDRRNEFDQKMTSVAESVQDRVGFLVILHCCLKAPLDTRKMELAFECHAGDAVCPDVESIRYLEWDSVSSLGKQRVRPAPQPQKRSTEPSAKPFDAPHAFHSALVLVDSQLWCQMCLHKRRRQMKVFAQHLGKRRPHAIPRLATPARFRTRSQGRKIRQGPDD